MKVPERLDYLLFGGAFILANKLQFVGDRTVEGLSTKQWFLARTILDLPEDPPPTIAQIARETDSSRQNVAKMLGKMARDGYVGIEEDGSDRRSRCVTLTQRGREEARRVTENGEVLLARLFEGIPAAELEAAARVTLKMIENLSVMQEEIREKENDGI